MTPEGVIKNTSPTVIRLIKTVVVFLHFLTNYAWSLNLSSMARVWRLWQIESGGEEEYAKVYIKASTQRVSHKKAAYLHLTSSIVTECYVYTWIRFILCTKIHCDTFVTQVLHVVRSRTLLLTMTKRALRVNFSFFKVFYQSKKIKTKTITMHILFINLRRIKLMIQSKILI